MCKDKLLAHNLTAWPEENQEKPLEAQDRLCAFFSSIQAPLEHRSVAAPVVPEVSSININKTSQMNRIYISCHVTVRMLMWQIDRPVLLSAMSIQAEMTDCTKVMIHATVMIITTIVFPIIRL